MESTDFQPGDKVHDNVNHRDGIVFSVTDVNVLVLYFNKRGELNYTAQATKPEQLIKR